MNKLVDGLKINSFSEIPAMHCTQAYADTYDVRIEMEFIE